jgi:hypothetical protein
MKLAGPYRQSRPRRRVGPQGRHLSERWRAVVLVAGNIRLGRPGTQPPNDDTDGRASDWAGTPRPERSGLTRSGSRPLPQAAECGVNSHQICPPFASNTGSDSILMQLARVLALVSIGESVRRSARSRPRSGRFHHRTHGARESSDCHLRAGEGGRRRHSGQRQGASVGLDAPTVERVGLCLGLNWRRSRASGRAKFTSSALVARGLSRV